MNAHLAALLYLVAGVLFILSLRGLSSPATSRQGNLFGMIGMAIAIATTLASHPPADGLAWLLVVLGIAIGGGLILSQVLTLYTTPVIYLWFDRLSRRMAARRAVAGGARA